AAIVDAHARQQVLDQIQPEDVAEQPVRRILETVSAITLEGLEPDMVLVGEYLKRDGDWLTIQKLIEIGELPKQTPQSVTQTQLYIAMVLDDARTRRAVKAAQSIIDRVKVDPSLDVEAELSKALAPVTSGVVSHKRMAGWNSDTIPEFRQWVEDNWNGVVEPDYVPSGFKKLDDMMRGGFHKGNLITVGARPGVGKALSLDTPIPTPDGWTTMGDLKVGDTVFDETGTPCKVTYATPIQYDRTCYRVVF